jgi:hypothetical protein
MFDSRMQIRQPTQGRCTQQEWWGHNPKSSKWLLTGWEELSYGPLVNR